MFGTRFALRTALALLVTMALTGLWPAAAQDYPSRPIRIVVPTPPGGMADQLSRIAAQKIGENTKATVVVENRTGGGGVVAADFVAKSAADGYTLYMGFHPTQAILPHLIAKLPYDAQKDFAPIIQIANIPNVPVVNPSVPAATLQDLVAHAKANPGGLSFASQGNGSSGHITGEQFKQIAGINIVHVPYRGAAPAIQDLIAGHVQLMFDIVPLALPQVTGGKVRALAVASPQRLAPMPNVPTMSEAGMPEIQGGAWFGLLAPAGTPAAVVDWVNRETKKVFLDAEISGRLTAQGSSLPLGTPGEYGAHIAAESKKWGEVIRRGNIKID
jgi:tripartite-type tricarboxylate transporter receptor subunit TctC